MSGPSTDKLFGAWATEATPGAVLTTSYNETTGWRTKPRSCRRKLVGGHIRCTFTHNGGACATLTLKVRTGDEGDDLSSELEDAQQVGADGVAQDVEIQLPATGSFVRDIPIMFPVPVNMLGLMAKVDNVGGGSGNNTLVVKFLAAGYAPQAQTEVVT